MNYLRVILVTHMIVFIGIVLFGPGLSNKRVNQKKQQQRNKLERWAIINREFVEYTQEEAEWRAKYVR